ncbi:MAG TPA: NAD(P)-binding domain-containing protein [Candidatus Binatia bacterium]|jgi:ornithine cyclodeaminase/alanine dehydrogenase-like protein (mu-crystallin family)
MALAISDEEITQLLSMSDAVGVLRQAYREIADDVAVNSPRVDLAGLTQKDDADARQGSVYLLKTMSGITTRYASVRLLSEHIRFSEGQGGKMRRERAKPGKYSPTRGSILLFDRSSANLVAVLSEGVIRNMRVGAAAALAAESLALGTADVVAIIGSGFMARAHLEALCQVRPIELAKVYSPSTEHREKFADELRETLGIKINAVESYEDAICDAAIVALTTNSIEAVFRRQDVKPRVHVSCVRHGEIDEESYRTFDKVYLNAKDVSGISYRIAGLPEGHAAPDFLVKNYQQGYPGDDMFWRNLPDLVDLVSGRVLGRQSSHETTCFDNSTGFAVQFTAMAGRVYELAVEKGMGTGIPDNVFPSL